MLFKLGDEGWGVYPDGTKQTCEKILSAVLENPKYLAVLRKAARSSVAARPSPTGGSGLFAVKPLAKKSYATVLSGGTLHPSVEATDETNTMFVPIHLYCKDPKTDGRLVVDGTASFREELIYNVNHSCKPNARFLDYWVAERVDGELHVISVVVVEALRSIKSGEEITVNYNNDRKSNRTCPGTIPCLCGHCDGKTLLHE